MCGYVLNTSIYNMKKVLLLFCLSFALYDAEAQHIIVSFGLGQDLAMAMMPEHGFLPGKKFKFYPATRSYDLHGKKLRVELHDVRDSLKLKTVECTPIELTNTSEFEGVYGTQVVEAYFDTLFPAANIVLDTSAADVVKVDLEALDARLIGFGNITAHGICMIKVHWRGNVHDYCVDITDKDPHSPVSSHAFVTRKTATRIIASAAIREVLEKIITDLEFDP
jgi:hypothetical protein